VLIHAGSGGVGHMAVQLAKVHFRARYVLASGSARNRGFMEVEASAPVHLSHSKAMTMMLTASARGNIHFHC
jgi:D-arabinose 1-dehydrogenase-like Zn-dependent alcohol dehydrogenase